MSKWLIVGWSSYLGVCGILSASPSLQLSSTRARYIGKEIILEGRVVVSHSWGTLVAGRAVYETPSASEADVLIFSSGDSGQQVEMRDERNELHADYVELHGLSQGKTSQPQHIILTGHVRLERRQEGEEEYSQHAYADRVDYIPGRQELLFTALPGNQVSYRDDLQRLQMHAPALSIQRDEKSGKERVYGRGDVHLSFMPNSTMEEKKK